MKPLKLIPFSFILSLCVATKTHAQTVYITKTGTKYHTKKCPQVKESKTKIKLKKAIQEGYTACPLCETDKLKKKKEYITEEPKEKEMPKND